MEFSSILFILFFLPAFLLAYYATPKKHRNLTFLLFSVFFYSWGGPMFIFMMLLLCILNYYGVNWMHKQSSQRSRKVVLIFTLLLNIGTLAYFKYANFFIENIQTVQKFLGFKSMGWEAVILPMGISFFTFQSITYIMDVYQKKHAPERRLIDYSLFILSFPQMIAGPIVQYNEIADEITNRKENIDDFLDGFVRFSIGLGKKVLIANVLAEQVDLILDAHNSVSSLVLWLGVIGYSFQIYFDFSGYSDMAVGLGKMVGFHFPENFNNPYISRNISEFWRRWHMTLGTWMKNYLYIPLGGNRSNSRARIFLNLWVVFLISGLWHGASWNFVIWGAFHGVFLILDRVFLIKWTERIGTVPSILLTFFVVTIGWVLFRMDTLKEAMEVYKGLFTFNVGSAYSIPTSYLFVFVLASFFSLFAILPKSSGVQAFFFGGPMRTNLNWITVSTISFLVMVLGLVFLAASEVNPFIYTRF